MSDLNYRVAIDFVTHGDLVPAMGALEAKAGGAHASMSKLGDMAKSVASTMAGAFTGAVERVGAFAARLGLLGGVAGFGAVTYGVTKLNAELENAQIGIAAILNANGQTADFPSAMAKSADLMRQIRNDAKALPGETQDLINIFQAIAIPGFSEAHKGADELRSMAANLMAFGIGVAHMPGEVVAREASMLLEGRAGAHNVLGMKLAGLGGDKATTFNAKSASERFEFVSKELKKFSPAIDAFGVSFEGLSSTFKDNVKNFARLATEGVFGQVKGVLFNANKWFDEHQDKVEYWAARVGIALTEAFGRGQEAIIEWYPAIKEFAINGILELETIWKRIEPIVAKVADHIQGFLADPAAFDKIEGVLKAYGAVKLGGMVAPGLQSFGGIGMEALGGLGAGAGVAGGIGLAILIPLLFAAAGAVHNFTDETSAYHDETLKLTAHMTSQGTQAIGEMQTAFGNLWTSLQPFSDFAGNVLVHELDGASMMIRQVSENFSVMTDVLKYHLTGLGIIDGMKTDQNGYLDHIRASRGQDIRGMSLGLPGVGASADPLKVLAKLGAGGGGGGTHVQKVEIVVTSNQDPLRIAEAVTKQLDRLGSHPKVTKSTRNFSQ